MRALLIFITAALASAQSSFDPYQFINKKTLNNADVNQLWRTLVISGKIRETTEYGSKDTSEVFKCGLDTQCQAKLMRPDWALFESGDDVLVRVSAPFSALDLSRFLVFHQDKPGGTWQLVDYLDSTHSHYAPAVASVISSGGKRWLVVNSFPRCGSDCGLNFSDWFELQNGKLRMVLGVPLSGDEISQNPGRNFETRFVRASQSGGRETLEFVFHAEFSSGFSPVQVNNLWSDEKIIRFSRPIGEGEFKFDSKNSEASEAFLDVFSTSEEVPQTRILKLVQDHLLAIARGRTISAEPGSRTYWRRTQICLNSRPSA